MANKKDPTLDLEVRLRNTHKNEDRFLLLNEIVKKYSSESYVINSKNVINVKDNANSLLMMSGSHRKNSLYADAVHHANISLGRAALFAGDIESGMSFLEASTKLYGPEKIKSPGPNMTLAKELLKLGQKNAVMDYLDASLKLWTDSSFSNKKISEWKKIIYEGSIPDFKESLEY
ncbi:MAG: hypothetical protein H7177_15080 [Rhizobacter sp.]|nr:hypothetical protein [Bacteriovorax sp.]